MSKALMSLANRVVTEDEPSQTRIGISTPNLTQYPPERTSSEQIKAALADLQKIGETSAHIQKIEPESLKTLCKLQLIDVTVSEKGKEKIRSFQEMEQLENELKGSAPPIDSISQYRKDHKEIPK